MKRSISIASLFVIGFAVCQAQVGVNKPIVFTGAEDDQRQLHGLPAVELPDALLNAEMELINVHRYAAPAMGMVWQLELPALGQGPIAGMHILVRSPVPSDGAVQIMIDQYGPFNVTRGTTGPVHGTEIPENTMLSLVFDGAAFQLINGGGHSPRTCPEGMVAVNGQYCIGTDQRAAAEFWEAIEVCGALGQRMCTWGEYYAACANASELEIGAIPNGWEWTNQTANEDMSVRIAGNTTCFGAATALSTSLRSYRCCLTR